MLRDIRLLPLVFLIALFGCGQDNGGGGGGTAPQISSFTANPTNITAPGQAVTLTWQVTGSATSLDIQASSGTSPGLVNGTSLLVNPTETTTYTLTASNSAGASNPMTATVTLGSGPDPIPGDDGAPPVGNFSVSLSQDSGFVNDRPDGIRNPNDPRIVRAQPGGTFYALVSYTDPAGITAVDINLVNSSPAGLAGTLVQGQDVSGFTLVGEIAGCDLSGAATSINCLYQINVGSDVQNITQLPGAGSEFAYVFRTMVTDAGGNVSDEAIRGYVTVGSSGGGTPTPPPPDPPAPPTPPTPPTPPAPPAPGNFTLEIDFEGTGSGTVNVPGFTNCGDDCERSIPAGTTLELQAVAAEGSQFSTWTGCNTVNADVCEVTMNSDKDVTVTFNTLGPPQTGGSNPF